MCFLVASTIHPSLPHEHSSSAIPEHIDPLKGEVGEVCRMIEGLFLSLLI